MTKTCKALTDALHALLEKRGFNHITVNDLCEQAQISRTTFYTHFNDKYDLLDYLLTWRISQFGEARGPGAHLRETLDMLMCDNEAVVRNLTDGANGETLVLLHRFVVSLMHLSGGNRDDGTLNTTRNVLSVFCAGGLTHYITWQLKNKSDDRHVMNDHLYNLLDYLQRWDPDAS